MARFFRVGYDTAKKWPFKDIPGARVGRKYDLRAINDWHRARNKQDPGAEDGNKVSVRTKHAEMEIAEAEARIKNQKADREAGLLLPCDEVRREVVEMAVRTRTRLLALADRIANIVPGELKATIKKVVTDSVRLVLKESADGVIAGDSLKQMIFEEADRLRDPISPQPDQ